MAGQHWNKGLQFRTTGWNCHYLTARSFKPYFILLSLNSNWIFPLQRIPLRLQQIWNILLLLFLLTFSKISFCWYDFKVSSYWIKILQRHFVLKTNHSQSKLQRTKVMFWSLKMHLTLYKMIKSLVFEGVAISLFLLRVRSVSEVQPQKKLSDRPTVWK